MVVVVVVVADLEEEAEVRREKMEWIGIVAFFLSSPPFLSPSLSPPLPVYLMVL